VCRFGGISSNTLYDSGIPVGRRSGRTYILLLASDTFFLRLKFRFCAIVGSV
jgi:hypothetical protein